MNYAWDIRFKINDLLEGVCGLYTAKYCVVWKKAFS